MMVFYMHHYIITSKNSITIGISLEINKDKKYMDYNIYNIVIMVNWNNTICYSIWVALKNRIMININRL